MLINFDHLLKKITSYSLKIFFYNVHFASLNDIVAGRCIVYVNGFMMKWIYPFSRSAWENVPHGRTSPHGTYTIMG